MFKLCRNIQRIEYFKTLCVRHYIQTKANFDKVFKSGGFEELEVKEL